MTATSGEDVLFSLSARQIAAAIAAGRVSAASALEAHIARIEDADPKLNAVVVKRYDAARREARAADERRARGEALGPLHGGDEPRALARFGAAGRLYGGERQCRTPDRVQLIARPWREHVALAAMAAIEAAARRRPDFPRTPVGG